MTRFRRRLALVLSLLFAAGAGAGSAQGPDARPLSARDSWKIGSAGVQCSAQARPLDAAAPGMFDRAYAIVCRDAAGEVGRLYALRAAGADPLAAALQQRTAALDCAAPTARASGWQAECKRRSDGLPWRLYAERRGPTLYIADGLRGYDSALTLGLRALVADRPVDGTVDVAVTEAGDPAAFARSQAGALDAAGALREGYARNNSGNFAEAAAFFGALVDGTSAGAGGGNTAEYLLNSGLQQANLGNDAAATAAFARAEAAGATTDPVLARMLRNYRAMALLNRQDAAGALAAAKAPVTAVAGAADLDIARGVVNAQLADAINRADRANRALGTVAGGLRPADRAALLDAQNTMLRGTALRMAGKPRDAIAAYAQARAQVAAVANGRVASAVFVDTEALTGAALAYEKLGDYPAADRAFADGVAMVDTAYPSSPAGLTAKARFAGYRLRRGDEAQALALYRQVVADGQQAPGGITPLRDLLKPYFGLLAARSDKDEGAVAALFEANQMLIRPGLAQTQAVLARELSAGDDKAATLFRQSVNRTREITRARADLAALTAAQPAGTADGPEVVVARKTLEGLEAEQAAIQSQLADYPRYRVLDAKPLTLAELQGALKPGEAFYELRTIGRDAYAIVVTPKIARGFKVAATTDQLGKQVATLRRSIARLDDKGQLVTDPFDVALARQLYVTLFAPVEALLADVTHLIWEADGPLLQLPPNLLITDDASVALYRQRAARPGADPYDFTRVAWLGRGRDITTAVSPKGFLQVRAAAPSRGARAYLGLGHNAPRDAMAALTGGGDPCAWPAQTWAYPISDAELKAGQQLFGPTQSRLLTGPAFTDTALDADPELARYRVVHFATHGLVTAPRPECPARPALVTSFGQGASDGLLTFREIYDLRLDADLVILSACDTAGAASAEATRDAGLATGGDFALDGLVRAFVGAGARTVVASHWPVPDDYDATKRLVLGTIGAPAGTPLATAMRRAEVQLMDQPQTSHPFYWAAFALVGDGARAVTR